MQRMKIAGVQIHRKCSNNDNQFAANNKRYNEEVYYNLQDIFEERNFNTRPLLVFIASLCTGHELLLLRDAIASY